MQRKRGYTLVELMIVVAVIALLAAIAVPSYLRYSYRARRADGQEVLLRVANAQERYYSTANHYGSLQEIGFNDPQGSNKGYYSVTSVPASGSTSQTFTATAGPLGPQAKDDCGSLAINNVGNKTSANTTTNGSCW
ncbi:MAG TPA: type IV pilin protein [Dyella sp.]|uniref:type IV pilin protein n=1 Tax=Dyella sp. TaxID=1869338 RepID=UPI002D7894FA|nr:type IV pilin protein [Dyella sp.]HET6553358.1 type IV pilin protein [Dyella sp.]